MYIQFIVVDAVWNQRFGLSPANPIAQRYFLDNVAEYILELDRGEGFPFKGNYSGFLEKKMARLELDAKIDNKRKSSLKRELEASVFMFMGEA